MWTCSDKNSSWTGRTALTVNQPYGSHRIFSSSLKYLDNSIWCTFLSCFMDAKMPTEWKKLIAWWPRAHNPQSYWSLRIDNAQPLWYHVITTPSTKQKIWHGLITHLVTPLPHLSLKNASLRPFEKFRSLEHELACSPCLTLAVNVFHSKRLHFCFFGLTVQAHKLEINTSAMFLFSSLKQGILDRSDFYLIRELRATVI